MLKSDSLITTLLQEVSRRVYEIKSSRVNTHQTHIYLLQMLNHFSGTPVVNALSSLNPINFKKYKNCTHKHRKWRHPCRPSSPPPSSLHVPRVLRNNHRKRNFVPQNSLKSRTEESTIGKQTLSLTRSLENFNTRDAMTKIYSHGGRYGAGIVYFEYINSFQKISNYQNDF